MKDTFLDKNIVAGFAKAIIFDMDRKLTSGEIRDFEEKYHVTLANVLGGQYVVVTEDGTEEELEELLKDLGAEKGLRQVTAPIFTP